MRVASRARHLWRNLRHRDQVEQELHDELTSTLELLAEEHTRAGMTPEQAHRAAALQLRVEPVKERVRDGRAGAAVETLLQDVRYAWRHLRRSPGFALAAIGTLALGIGANTAMFSMLHTLALRQLPIDDPDGLIAIAPMTSRGLPRSIPISAVEVLARDGPLESLCGYLGAVGVPVLANDIPAQRSVTFVTGECFDAFRVTPILGRPITEADAPIFRPGARVAVISHGLWTSVFGGDPSVLGRSMSVNSVDVEIVGVLPRGFGGLEIHQGIDIFTPYDSVIPATGSRRQLADVLLGRLRRGVTLEQAAAQIEGRWATVLETAVPASLPASEVAQLRDSRPRLQRMGTGISGLRERYLKPVTLVFGLTSLLLLLACVNLSGLLLARLASRQSELALKVALGGTRWRIARQILVENLLLSLAGGALALPVAYAVVAALRSVMSPINLASAMAFDLEPAVLGLTGGVALVISLLISGLPMRIAVRQRPGTSLMWDRTIAGQTGRWGRSFLVAQVALSVVLVTSALLLTRSLYLLLSTPLGIRTSDVVDVLLDRLPNAPPVDRESYHRRLLEHTKVLPGVRSAALSMNFPRAVNFPTGSPIAFTGEEHRGIETAAEYVSPSFFSTVGISLRSGRDFTWFDKREAPRVCILSESLAQALAPDGNVFGRSVTMITMPVLECIVIGVAADASRGDPRDTHPHVVYQPALYLSSASTLARHLLVHTSEPQVLAVAMPEILRREGQHYAREIIGLDDLFGRAPATERMSATVAAGIGALAVLLALVGIYGALAYAVSRRRREIGVRLALGAPPGAVARSVVRDALTVTMIGLSIGVPAAALTSRSLRSLVYGISENDITTFAAISLFFVLLGLAAALGPARRAAGVDPIIALRAE